MTHVRVRLLGTCLVETEDGVHRLTPIRAILLARLVLTPGEPVTTGQLVEALFPEPPNLPRKPESKRQHEVNVYRTVNGFRSLFDQERYGHLVVTRRGRESTTYHTGLARSEIDVFQFIDLTDQAADAPPERAAVLLRQALELHAGPPLLDARDRPFAQDMIADLNRRKEAAERQLAATPPAAEPDPVPDPGPAPLGRRGRRRRGPVSLTEVLDGLVGVVSRQSDDEYERRELNPVPLPVSWRVADPDLVQPWPELLATVASWPGGSIAATTEPPELAGTGGDVRDVLRRVPTGRLVVLGEPGAGKTILLVRLQREILHYRRPDEPVPVRISLTSWNPTTDRLRDWLADQLIRDYPGLAGPAPGERSSLNQAQALLERRLILPLLDGLDEMTDATRAVAVHRLSTGLRAWDGVVLACRTADYRAMVDRPGGQPLAGAAAIVLEPPDPTAVAGYLRRGATDARSVARWRRVESTLDSNTPVGQALRIPLMISLATTAGNPSPDGDEPAVHPDDLCDTTRFPTATAVRSRLFDSFVATAFRVRPGHSGPSWPRDRARHWLSFLAWHLDQRETTEFAWWQLRLATWAGLAPAVAGTACGLGVALFIGLAGPLTDLLGGAPAKHISPGPGIGILTGLAVAWLLRRHRPPGSPVVGLGLGLAGGLIGGLLAGLADLAGVGHAAWPAGGLGAALAVGAATGPLAGRRAALASGVVGGLAAAISPGTLGPATMGPGLAGIASALITGLAVAVAAAQTIDRAGQKLPSRRPEWTPAGLWGGAAIGPAVGLATALVAGPALGLVATVVVAVAAGWVTGMSPAAASLTDATSPGLVLARDRVAFLRYAAAAFATGGLVGLLADGLDAIRTNDVTAQLHALLANGLAVGIAAAIACAIVLGFLHSAWATFLIVRFRLALRGDLPWRLMPFLEHCRDEGVLRQSGPVYQFRHADLQHHLAGEYQPRW